MKTLLVLALAALLATLRARADGQVRIREGASCRHMRRGMEGRCRYLRDCPSAQAELRNNTYPEMCGWRPGARIPNVCCVDLGLAPTLNRTPPDGTVARRKCLEYSRAVSDWNLCHTINPGPPPNVPRPIVGGAPAGRREFPHMVLLGYGPPGNVTFHCGGTLISNQWVLAAAHCRKHPNKGQVTTVLLGDLDTSVHDDDARPQRVDVEKVEFRGYSAPASYNDIMLLKLKSPVTFSEYVRPACLDTRAVVAGGEVLDSSWSNKEPGNDDRGLMLKKTRLNIIDNKECHATYKDQRKLPLGILGSQLCAVSEDACEDDTGGPLQTFTATDPFCMYHVVGVGSTRAQCSRSFPWVYTRVSSFLPWIERTVWPAYYRKQNGPQSNAKLLSRPPKSKATI